ncbi:MAG: site-2 protease family protein [Chloroflexota bacterium]
MNSSLTLFTIRGIDVRVHITFPLILLWAAYQFGVVASGGLLGAIFGITVVTILFGIVTLHELGHSFAALHYGIPVKDIVLLPIGGVAQLREMPENPKQEFVIAAAGPAVNVALAVILGVVALLFNIPVISGAVAALTGGGTLTFASILSYVFISNLSLAVFNLIPAFPMDGGRILRSLLALRLDYPRATSIAARVGQAMAVLMGLYGLYAGAFFLVLIAIFVYSGAKRENDMVLQRAKLKGLTVEQVFSRQVQALQPFNTLQDAMTLKFQTGQSNFPVYDGFRYTGLLTSARLKEAAQKMSGWTAVKSFVRQDLPVVKPTDTLSQAYRLLQKHETEALPVVDGQTFLGVVTLNNIQEAYRYFMKADRPRLQGQPA